MNTQNIVLLFSLTILSANIHAANTKVFTIQDRNHQCKVLQELTETICHKEAPKYILKTEDNVQIDNAFFSKDGTYLKLTFNEQNKEPVIWDIINRKLATIENEEFINKASQVAKHKKCHLIAAIQNAKTNYLRFFNKYTWAKCMGIGTATVPLCSNLAQFISVYFSPGGRYVLFVMEENNEQKLYAYNLINEGRPTNIPANRSKKLIPEDVTKEKSITYKPCSSEIKSINYKMGTEEQYTSIVISPDVRYCAAIHQNIIGIFDLKVFLEKDTTRLYDLYD